MISLTRYHDHWRQTTQNVIFAAALVCYLERNELLALSDLDAIFFCPDSQTENSLHFDSEDYLHGICMISSELSRWAVNSVTSGAFDRPLKISQFLSELHGGFRLLNLKNDFLRKKFDSMKYDIKKVEEIVYDLSIRQLGDSIKS
eukprot:Sdes_comp20768_c0_seq6m16787